MVWLRIRSARSWGTVLSMGPSLLSNVLLEAADMSDGGGIAGAGCRKPCRLLVAANMQAAGGAKSRSESGCARDNCTG